MAITAKGRLVALDPFESYQQIRASDESPLRLRSRQGRLHAVASILSSWSITLALEDGGCEMTTPIARFFALLIPLWFASGAWGYFISEPPEGACYTGPDGVISRLEQAYNNFSVPSEVRGIIGDESPDPRETWHRIHTAHFAEERTSEFLAGAHAESAMGHHLGAATILVGAFLLAYPAGVVLRYAIDTEPCPLGP